MNVNGQTEMMMTYAEALQEGQKQSRELIADIRALAEGKGMVWSELTEEEITDLVVDYELNKATGALEKEEMPKKVWKNLCVNCGIDMGDDNPRQLCQKTHCDNDEGEYLEQVQEQVQVQEQAQVPAQEQVQAQVPAQVQAQVPAQVQAPQLMLGSATQVLDHIARLTERFSKLDAHFTYWLINRIGSRPMTTFGYLPAPLETSACKQVIGKDGCYFKMTTVNTGVDFIWHDRTENHFLFWGPHQSVLEAMKMIRGRMDNNNNLYQRSK